MSAALAALPAPTRTYEIVYNYFYGVVSCLVCERTVGSYAGLKTHRLRCHGSVAIFARFEAQFPAPVKERSEFGSVTELRRAITGQALAEYRAVVPAAGGYCQCRHRESQHFGGVCTAIYGNGEGCECTEFFPSHRRRPNGKGRTDALLRAVSLDAPLGSDGESKRTLADVLPYYHDTYAV
jgi:hypothetical protein